MPMNWNAETDARLLLGILKIYDVKVTPGPKLDELNAFMGPECVGHAIKNRLARLKKAAEHDGADTEAVDSPTPKTPKSCKRKSTESSMDDNESPVKKKPSI